MKDSKQVGKRQPYIRKIDNRLVGLFFVAAGVYLLLACVLTYPLVFEFGSGILGDGGDGPQFLWNLWWVRETIFEYGVSSFYTDRLFAPEGVSLYLHTLTYSNGLIAVPFVKALGVVVTQNLIFLGGMVLAGLGGYCLGFHFTKKFWPALFAGAVVAFMPYVFYHSLGHYNLTTIWPLPFFVLFCFRTFKKKGFTDPILAAFFLIVITYNDLQYSLYALMFLGLFLVWHVVVRARRFFGKFVFLRFVALVVIFVCEGRWCLCRFLGMC